MTPNKNGAGNGGLHCGFMVASGSAVPDLRRSADHACDPCPFQIGDTVRYTPSSRGYAVEVMSAPEGKLVPGRTYRVERIEEQSYVVVEGCSHPGGGLYWTEFTKV
jgi:hypothetical protein